MNETQQRIYDYIKHLCSSCVLAYPSGGQVDNLPVMLTRQCIADKLKLSEKTIQRNLDWLVDNKYIYRVEFNHSYIYNIEQINNNHDLFVRVKLT